MKYMILLVFLPLIFLSSCRYNEKDSYYEMRIDMVEKQLKSYGIEDETVLFVMKKVARHLFVPENMLDKAYNDHPLPIGEGQTISQPYIVALMTETLELEQGDKVLEIGTGSGYQTAFLAEFSGTVYTVERIADLSDKAIERLKNMGYNNVYNKTGDGSRGWPENSPYDRIIVTAAAGRMPEIILQQLAPCGRMVIPLGPPEVQDLLLIIKKADGSIEIKPAGKVRFVEFRGEYGWSR